MKDKKDILLSIGAVTYTHQANRRNGQGRALQGDVRQEQRRPEPLEAVRRATQPRRQALRRQRQGLPLQGDARRERQGPGRAACTTATRATRPSGADIST